MTPKKTVRDIDLTGKTVLLRSELNVPIVDGAVTSDEAWRVHAALPTIQFLVGKGCKVVLVTHLGRPQGERVPELSTQQLQQYLTDSLDGVPVAFSPDIVGPSVDAMVSAMDPGTVLLLENIRFDARETRNDEEFAKALAGLADLFVNDAFGTAHRAHASTVGVAAFIPCVAGLQMEKEILGLSPLIEGFTPPVLSILSGLKLETKLPIIRTFADRYDHVAIGGGLANTLYKAQGYEVGRSLVDDGMLGDAESIVQDLGEKLVLSPDVVVATSVDAGVEHAVKMVDALDPDDIILDMGPLGVQQITDLIDRVQTVVWNGPLGMCEVAPYNAATDAIAEALANSGSGMKTVVGGGDTVTAVVRAGHIENFDLISTGGGAMLEYLEGKPLPGIEAIANAAS